MLPAPPGRSPPELALWQARGEAALAAGEDETAAQAWQILSEARPGDWRAWANNGQCLAKLERWGEAAAALRHAVRIRPDEDGLRQKLASALANAEEFDEAAREFARHLDRHPDDIVSRLTLARLLADLGREHDAVRQFDEAAERTVGSATLASGKTSLIAIALGPDHRRGDPFSQSQLQSVQELALLLERTNRTDELRALLHEAADRDVPPEGLAYPAAAIALRDGDAARAKVLLEAGSDKKDAARWHRLMAKIADALGESSLAFEQTQAMNSAVPDFDSWTRRAADYRSKLRALAARMTDQWASSLMPLEPGKRRTPAFLVGFPRSGTTLLDTFLMGHPDTRVLEEFHMLGAAEKVLGNVADLPRRSRADLERARTAYFTELHRHCDPDFSGLVVDKLPLNMLGIGMIHCLFPDAKIIFAQRHPCDCVLSCFMQSFVMNDAMACFLGIDASADLYDAAMTVFERSREALPVNVHTLVYEDLVSDPEAGLRPLIEFLGLEWRAELLDHRSTAKARGAVITPSYDQIVQPLSKAPSGRWKRYAEQMEPVLPILLPWAKRLGYAD